jgi:hypothetical protein
MVTWRRKSCTHARRSDVCCHALAAAGEPGGDAPVCSCAGCWASPLSTQTVAWLQQPGGAGRGLMQRPSPCLPQCRVRGGHARPATPSSRSTPGQ